jgi:hypothetical protein
VNLRLHGSPLQSLLRLVPDSRRGLLISLLPDRRWGRKGHLRLCIGNTLQRGRWRLFNQNMRGNFSLGAFDCQDQGAILR